MAWEHAPTITGDTTAALAQACGRWQVAGDAELVSLGIPEVGTVVVLMIFRPEPRRTFRNTAMRWRNAVRTVDRGATAGEEHHHLPITLPMRCSVVWRPDEKQGTWVVRQRFASRPRDDVDRRTERRFQDMASVRGKTRTPAQNRGLPRRDVRTIESPETGLMRLAPVARATMQSARAAKRVTIAG